MKKLFLIPVLIILISCSSSNNGMYSSNAKDYVFPKKGKYGYSEDNPVCVGGVNDGPRMEREYLNSLTGPNGERVSFYRTGSCCTFLTSKSSFGGGALDRYKVWYVGIKDTAFIYINMYYKEALQPPEGFVFRE